MNFLGLTISLLISPLVWAEVPSKSLSKIASELNCRVAIGANSESTLVCFRDDVMDLGLETETRGCAVRLYDLTNNKWIGFQSGASGQMILTPQDCQKGGLQAVLSWPVTEQATLHDYIKSAYQSTPDIQDFAKSEVQAIRDLIQEIRQSSSLESGIERSAPPAAAPAPLPRPKGSRGDSYMNHATVEVFYGSDRKFKASQPPAESFSNERSPDGTIKLGKVSVSIPLSHQYGNLELPSVFKIQMTPNPDKFIVVKELTVLENEKFFLELNQRVSKSPRKDLIVFIPGFNTSFEESAQRTAQMAFDLKFPGAPVFYSWPAESILRYAIAEKNIEWSLAHITNFLKDLAEKSGAQEIHLIAHSMGNRALTTALSLLARTSSANSEAIFKNVILAAPDVDQKDFRQIERAVRSTTKNLTLYASDSDRALQISARIHKEPRLGQAGDHTLISPWIDTVDASEVDTSLMGHAYFGDNASVMDDIGQIIMGSLPAFLRQPMILQKASVGDYWRIPRLL